jgi:hypothetical protein
LFKAAVDRVLGLVGGCSNAALCGGMVDMVVSVAVVLLNSFWRFLSSSSRLCRIVSSTNSGGT